MKAKRKRRMSRRRRERTYIAVMVLLAIAVSIGLTRSVMRDDKEFEEYEQQSQQDGNNGGYSDAGEEYKPDTNEVVNEWLEMYEKYMGKGGEKE